MIGDLMCDCFKPSYTDYDFGYGVGVMGHLMHEYDHVGFHIFSDADISDGQSCLRLMGPLRERLKAEIRRASEQPLEEMSPFEESSKTTEDFRKGYVAGLNEMYQGLIDLARLMINHPEETLDVKLIHDWAEDWQKNTKSFISIKFQYLLRQTWVWVTTSESCQSRWLGCVTTARHRLVIVG